MLIIELILLSIALAMDCFTVSITCGLIQRRLVTKTMLITALMFGLFQGLMPLIGWAAVYPDITHPAIIGLFVVMIIRMSF